ncbi:MAG: RNA pseudouridine synthase [Pseudobutyrivibrio sp.]|nr:RNA pseudouridine synthase [Pseudobutyrivibrio sp.]
MEVLFEDKDLIVCTKEAGVPTQTKNASQKDMESILAGYLKENGEEPRVFVVHRLDQHVEGVMVFAKNQKTASALSKQITDHTFVKKYYAIISRESFPDQGELVDYLVKDTRTNMSKVVKESDPRAKKASLKYRVIDTWDDKKLLDISLYTGRHHQIRIQLASRTAPIVGDVKYGGVATGRSLALCSHFIGFVHPTTGDRMEFDIKPTGEDFKDSRVLG